MSTDSPHLSASYGGRPIALKLPRSHELSAPDLKSDKAPGTPAAVWKLVATRAWVGFNLVGLDLAKVLRLLLTLCDTCSVGI